MKGKASDWDDEESEEEEDDDEQPDVVDDGKLRCQRCKGTVEGPKFRF